RARVPPAGPPGGSAPPGPRHPARPAARRHPARAPGPRTAGPRSGGRGVPGRARPRLRSISMSHPDDLLAGIAAMVEADQDSQMSLTVVVSGAVITGRLAPEALWRARVAEVLRDSARLRHFAVPFAEAREADAPPTHLHFHLARILQGSYGIPDTGGMYRVALADVSAWTIGDIGYSDE